MNVLEKHAFDGLPLLPGLVGQLLFRIRSGFVGAVAAAAAGALLLAAVVTPAAAASGHVGAGGHARTVTQTFRIAVDGPVARGTTFWVAYGPLGGHFGVFQLHPSSPGVYSASRQLPLGGRTNFFYLAAQGTIQTRFGPAPGDPVVTIKDTGRITVTPAPLPLVRWQAPVG